MEMYGGLRYSLDVENLEFPICTEPLSTPVYQCENGHMLCSTCCKKLTKGPSWSRTCSCPSCSQPTGRIRCLGVEKIIESLQVSCKHSPYTQMLHYNKRAEREDHENETCEHNPFPCPHPSCWHEGPSPALPLHLAEVHGVRRTRLKFLVSASKDFVTVEVENHVLLLVHRDQDENGDRFFCTTISGDCNVHNLKVEKSGVVVGLCHGDFGAQHWEEWGKVMECQRMSLGASGGCNSSPGVRCRDKASFNN